MSWVETPFEPWVAPDVETNLYKNGNTPKVESLVWIIIALSTALVALRVCYRIFRSHLRLWSDDYFLLSSLLCLIGNGITMHLWIQYKLEPNLTATVPPLQILSGSLMGHFNSFSLAFSKTSLAITFIRLTTGWWKSTLGISIVAMNVLLAIQAWTYWLKDCNGPAEPYRVQATDCPFHTSIRDFRLSIQVLSCAMDAYFTVLPWKIVRSLELKRFEKIGLAIAMSFGCASLISGLVRLGILIDLANDWYWHQPYYYVQGFLFNYLEAGFSIVAACIPVLRKVVMDMIQWKKNNPGFNWSLNRRKNRSSTTILPTTENSEKLISEGQSTATNTNTDSTLVSEGNSASDTSNMMSSTTLASPTKGGKVVTSSEMNRSLVGLPRVAY